MIDIKDIKGNVIYSTPINQGSKRKFELMQADHITLRFSLDTPINFPIGCYVDDSNIGLFERVDNIYKPKYNNSTGGYDYELQLEAYYRKWKNKIFKFTPEVGGQEASWSLTASLDVHMGIFLRNLKALGYTYRGNEFEFAIDSTVENKAVSMTYDNMNMLDALLSMAESWGCEVWVTDNVIHFGRCEYGTPVDFELNVNVAEMTRSESKSVYATRIYAFGSTKNLPANYRPVDESVVVNGIVQRRLMLPEGTPYVDAFEGLTEAEAIEQVVIFDDVYPRTQGSIDSVETYERTVENEDGTTTTETFYRFKDSGITFSKDYILEGEELKIKFESGLLNGMEFGLVFNPEALPEKIKNEETGEEEWNPEAQLFEVVASEDYGRKLPDSTLKPQRGDTYILIGWDSTKIADLGLISNAENELLTKAQQYVEKSKVDPNTYQCKMMSDYMYGLDSDGNLDTNYAKVFEVGDRVNLVNEGYFENGRQSRIIGYEYNLDYPYDNPIYTVGETASYSRIGDIESKLDALTYGGQTYNGVGGSGVYVIGTNDNTTPSNRNVYSALKSDQRFLRKDKPDTAKEKITFEKGIEIWKYVDGIQGGAFKFDESKNRTYIEADVITARVKAYFETLEVAKALTTRGKMIISPAGSVTLVGVDDRDIIDNGDGTTSEIVYDYYRCYFLAEQDGELIDYPFVNGDLVYCKTFNIVKEGFGGSLSASNRYYWNYTSDSLDASIVEFEGKKCYYVKLDKVTRDVEDGSIVPMKGDVICHRGHVSDPSRQCFIEISTVENNSPSIVLFQGVGQMYETDENGDTIYLNPFTLEDKDIIRMGWDTDTNQPVFKAYGSMYFGDRGGDKEKPNEDSTYIKFDTKNGLEVKGTLKVGSTIGESKEMTVVKDGLIQSSYIKLGLNENESEEGSEALEKNFVVWAGTSGKYSKDKRGHGIASWFGGDPIDLFDYYNETSDLFDVPEGVRPATGLDRMDGTGYRANGRLWWDNTGKVYADPLSFFVGTDTVGSLLLAFQVDTKKEEIDGKETGKLIPTLITPKAPFGTLTVNKELFIGDKKIYKSKDDVIFIDANVVVRGGITMYGTNATTAPTIWEGIPIDNDTIYWDNGVIKAKGEGFLTGITSQMVVDALGYTPLREHQTIYALTIQKNGVDVDTYTPNSAKKTINILVPVKVSELENDSKFATTKDLDDRVSALVNGAPEALDTLKEIADVLEGNVDSIGDIITTLGTKADKATTLSGYGITDAYTSAKVDELLKAINDTIATKWTQDDEKIKNWDAAYGWGDHSKGGYAKKTYVDETFVTIEGTEDVTGVHDFTNGLKIGGIKIRESQDGVVYVEGNLVVKGGVTMYADDTVDVPSFIESLPTAGYDEFNARGLAAFNSSHFTITNGVVSIIGENVGLNESQLKAYLESNGYINSLEGYATQEWVGSTLSAYATQEWVTNQKYLTDIDKALVTSALGFTPLDSAKWTKNEVKTLLGISDWALEATKPSYTTTEVTEGTNLYFTNKRAVDALGETLKSYVTLSGKQTITGEKDFTGGLKVNGSPIVYDVDKGYWYLTGDLIVSGGVTMYGNIGTYTPSTIMDGVVVDGITIIKQNGKLVALGGGGGGGSELDTVAWGNVLGKPDWITDAKPDFINPFSLSWNGRETGSYDGSVPKTFYIPTKLSELTDDVVSGKYLPLNSSRINGNGSYLILSGGSTSTQGVVVGSAETDMHLRPYQRTENNLMKLGSLNFRWGDIYSVLGNFSGQITSSVATGTAPFKVASTTLVSNLNADMLDGQHASRFIGLYTRADIGTAPNFDNPSVNGLFEIRPESGMPDATGERPFNGNAPFFSIKSQNVMMQIAGRNTAGWYIRGRQSANVTLEGVAWQRLVIEDALAREWSISVKGNAATATKLKTAVSLWGNNFNGSSDITGNLYFENSRTIYCKDKNGVYNSAVVFSADNTFRFGLGAATNGYNTCLIGNRVFLQYGNDAAAGFLLNESGNVGIGTTSPAYKLDVNGTTRIVGATTLNSSLSVGSTLTLNGINIKKSQDGVLYIDGNLVVKGGITMYGTDVTTSDSILDNLPIASTTAKGIAQFNPSFFSVSEGVVSIPYATTTTAGVSLFDTNYFTVSGGKVSLIPDNVGLNEERLGAYLSGKGYLTSSNFNFYAPKLDGTGATGTWGINVSGIAAKATADASGNIIADTYLKKSGDTMSGELKIKTSTNNQIRLIDNIDNYGVLLRNDNTFFYFLLTDKKNVNGGWNNLRPLKIGLSTGSVSIGHSFYAPNSYFSGQITSTVADGTAPFVVASKTLVNNLNADLLDGVQLNGLFTSASYTGMQTDGTMPKIGITVGGVTKEATLGYDSLVRKSFVFTSTSLSSYWVKVASVTLKPNFNVYAATLSVEEPYGNSRTVDGKNVFYGSSLVKWTCYVGTATMTPLTSVSILGSIPLKFRSYHSGAGGSTTFELWVNLEKQNNGLAVTVLQETGRGYQTTPFIATYYNNQFSTVQPSTSLTNYVDSQFDHIGNSSESATKLQTARTLWGNSFDGSSNVTGQIVATQGIHVNTSSGSYPLSISRLGGANQITKIYQDGIGLVFDVTNDEKISRVVWKFTATDIEGSDGTDAKSGELRFGLNDSSKTYFAANEFQGIATSANRLETPRTLWGQSFNGTGNISGDLTGVGSIIATKAIGLISLSNGIIEFKFNNDNTNAITLQKSVFRPSIDSNGLINLGNATSRWNGIYGQSLDVTGNITSGGRGSFASNLRVGETTYAESKYLVHIQAKENTQEALRIRSSIGGAGFTLIGKDNGISLETYTDEILRIDRRSNTGVFVSSLAQIDNEGYFVFRKVNIGDGFGSNKKAEYTLGVYGTLGVTGASTFKAQTTHSAGLLSTTGSFSDSVTINGIKINKSQDGTLYINGNLVVSGGVTMYGTNATTTPSIFDSLPIASTSVKGIAQFDGSYFTVNNGLVSLIPENVGLNETKLNAYLTTNGYINSDALTTKLGDYALKTGANASGTWGISVSGSSAVLQGATSTSSVTISGLDRGQLVYRYNIKNGTTGLFNTNNDANAIIAMNRHHEGCWSQLGFSNDGRIYYRAANDNTTAWNKVAFTSDLNGYLPKSGGTITGVLGMAMTTDTSNEKGLTWYKTDGVTQIASITYHNTGKNIILNPIGSSYTYSDAEGKYSLVIGNNKLTYNTHYIYHKGLIDTLKTDLGLGSNAYTSTAYLPSASYTASDVLSKLKTVDGSGSGLDADMLDGCQLATFMTFLSRTNYVKATFNDSALSTLATGDGYIEFWDSSANGWMNSQWGNITAFNITARTAFIGSLTGNASSASKLNDDSSYSAWGQTFFSGGTPNSISGNMTGVGSISASGNITTSGKLVTNGARVEANGSNGSAIGLFATGTTYSLGFIIGDGGVNRGIYDYYNGSWMLYRDSSADVYIPYGNLRLGSTAYFGGNANISGNANVSGYVKCGSAVFLQNGPFAELSSGGNEMILSGGANMYVNYRSSAYGRNVPSSWVWNAGSGSSYASFTIGGLTANGNILATGGITMYSQRSLKNVMDERGLSLKELRVIKPTRYTWKDGRDDRLHIGGIADDIEQVLPEVVYKNNDGVLTLDYGNAAFAIAASLIRPVIDHETRIERLERENRELKEEIERLKRA